LKVGRHTLPTALSEDDLHQQQQEEEEEEEEEEEISNCEETGTYKDMESAEKVASPQGTVLGLPAIVDGDARATGDDTGAHRKSRIPVSTPSQQQAPQAPTAGGASIPFSSLIQQQRLHEEVEEKHQEELVSRASDINSSALFSPLAIAMRPAAPDDDQNYTKLW